LFPAVVVSALGGLSFATDIVRFNPVTQ